MSRSTRTPGPRRRRAELLDTAAEIFHRQGYSAASVHDIAQALGILKGSIYYYVETKEDLLFLLLTGVQDDVERIRLDVAAEDGLGPLERLQLYVRRQAEYNMRNLVRISVFLHDLERLSEPRRAQMLARRRVHHDYVEELIVQAQHEGLVDPVRDATVLRHCLFASIVWTYRWYRSSGPSGPAEIAELCAQFALHGLRRRVAPPAVDQTVVGYARGAETDRGGRQA